MPINYECDLCGHSVIRVEDRVTVRADKQPARVYHNACWRKVLAAAPTISRKPPEGVEEIHFQKPRRIHVGKQLDLTEIAPEDRERKR